MRLLDENAEALMARAIEAGLGDDGIMLRDCLRKLIGTRRGQPLVLDDVADFPEVSGPEDLKAAIALVTRGLGEGWLTPEEGLHLSETLNGLAPVLAAARAEAPGDAEDDPLQELERRLDRLARQIEKDEAERAAEAARAGDAEAEAMAAAWVGLEAAE